MSILFLALGWLKSAFSTLLGVVTRNPWPCAVVASLCLAAWFWHGKNEAVDRGNAFKQVAVDEIQAHKATKTAYVNAQKQAAALETARLNRVKAIQESINDTSKESYSRRIADADERYRVRAQVRTSADGKAGSVAVPGVSPAAGGTAQAPGDELSWQLTAEKQAIQLDELISWVQRQATVQTN